MKYHRVLTNANKGSKKEITHTNSEINYTREDLESNKFNKRYKWKSNKDIDRFIANLSSTKNIQLSIQRIKGYNGILLKERVDEETNRI